MSEYTYAVDDGDEHGERYGVATLVVEIDPLTGRLVEATAEGEATEEDEDERAGGVRVKLVCSCGFATCPAVRRYGHPEPVFEAEIRPLPSQFARDQRALALHAEAACAEA